MSNLQKKLVELVDLTEEQRAEYLKKVSGPERAELREAISSYMEVSDYLERLSRTLNLPATTVVPDKTSHKMPDLIGKTVGRYQVQDHLGGGGMGTIYVAEDGQLGRQVALKILPDSVSADRSARQRFLREAQSASALDHPNICTIYEIGESDGRSYIAMALYEGQTLRQMIERGPLDVDSAMDISLQIADGLAAAHERGIVHRDIKPENVIVLSDGLVKILDFGLAKGSEDATVTREGTVLGTAGYMSPEQATGEAVDHRTDIWSLGAVVYEMLSGVRPFPGDYPQAVLYSILNTDPEPLSGLRTGLPLQLVEIVEQTLQKEPDQRFARIQEFIDGIKSVRNRAAARSEARQMLSDELESAPPHTAPSTSAASDEVLRILCVDDEPELELLMQQRFRKNIRAGEWQFTFALDGQDALQKLEQHPGIGLILTDLNMPRMDGLTLLDRLGDMKRPVRTIVVSAYGDMDKIRTAMNRGAFDFVTKPIDFTDLKATIHKASTDLSALRSALRGQQQAVSIQQEMDVARRIQDATLPVDFPEGAFGFSSPAGEINSTFYDAFGIDDDHIALVAGDVGIRGVTSTLLLAMGQTFVKGLLQQRVSVEQTISMLNRMLFADGLPNLNLQLFVAVVNTATGQVRWANAGHQSALILRAGGSIDVLDLAGVSVWADTAAGWSSQTEELEMGDVLVLCSRGCTDALSRDGRPFSLERLSAALRESEDTRPTAIIRHLLRSINSHLDGEEPRKDLTVVALKR